MSIELALLSFVVLLLLSAIFSGSETGVYSLSRARLESEVRQGSRAARLLSSVLRDDTAILITLLIGNNLMLELATHLAEHQVDGVEGLPPWAHEVVITLVLTPLVFLFGELFPKDAFRRRPHLLLGICAPLLSFVRILFLPLSWPLVRLSRVLERMLGVRESEFTRALGREEVFDILEEGTRAGALAPHAEALARNVLIMRETPVSEVMIPWGRVESIDLDAEEHEVSRAIDASDFTRLPVLSSRSGERRVEGYLYQLDVYRAAAAQGGTAASDVLAALRVLPNLPPDLPVDRALGRLRLSGQRVALVGTPESPLGLATVMDLVTRISSDLGAVGSKKAGLAATSRRG